MRLQLEQLELRDCPATIHAYAFPMEWNGDQWGLYNVKTDCWLGCGKQHADIDAPEAWDITHTIKTPIAILDEGIDYRHPDLTANYIPGGYDYISKDNDPFYTSYLEDHATAVASVIGAVGDNTINSITLINGTVIENPANLVGAAWNVRLADFRILDQYGTGTTDIAIKSIQDMASQGFRVANLSWGFKSFSRPLYNAIKAASNVIFVVASGNDGVNNDTSLRRSFPASYNLPNIISVGASDENDELTSWSNYGRSSVDLVAPGNGIKVLRPNYSWQYLSGTSLAAPFVAAAAGYVFDVHPNWTPSQVREYIINFGVDKLPWLENKVVSGGRLNLLKVLTGNLERLNGPTLNRAPLAKLDSFRLHAGVNKIPVLANDVDRNNSGGQLRILISVFVDCPFNWEFHYDNNYVWVTVFKVISGYVNYFPYTVENSFGLVDWGVVVIWS